MASTTTLPNIQAFKVAAVSSNTNSFGLYGHILVTENGVVYEAAANSINKREVGDILRVPVDYSTRDANGDPITDYNFYAYGFEIPNRMPDMPDHIVKEVWK